jgi:hypothetical protein
MQESIQYESQDDLVIGQLQARDHIFVEIDSQDIWLKVFLKMNSQDEQTFESEFEIKIENQTSSKELKIVLQKLCISIWNRLCRENQNLNFMINEGEFGYENTYRRQMSSRM